MPSLKSKDDILFSSVSKIPVIDHILGPERKSNILPEGKKMYLFIQKVLSEQLLQASLYPGSITVVNKKHRVPISTEFRI